MRVYRFLCAKYGTKSIIERQLKISELSSLNDPFEFFCADFSDKDFRRAMTRTKEEIAKKRGLISFSKHWRNPLLWGHYSDRHKGLCLGFDVPKSNLSKVNYVRARVKIDRDINEPQMKTFLTTKFKHWHYEDEYRAFFALEDKQADGKFYAEFSDKLVLKEVIVGANSSLTRQELAGALGSLKNVATFKARAAFQTFAIVRNRNEQLWA